MLEILEKANVWVVHDHHPLFYVPIRIALELASHKFRFMNCNHGKEFLYYILLLKFYYAIGFVQ